MFFKVQQQIRFMWMRYIKNKKYPEVNGVQTSLVSANKIGIHRTIITASIKK